MSRYCRLFFGSVPPSAIVEHPPTLPTVRDLMPGGPIEGWECYAPNFGHGPDSIVGPFDPVVEIKYGLPYIRAGSAKFWYGNENDKEAGRPDRPCWHQSGMTLRFLPKKPPQR